MIMPAVKEFLEELRTNFSYNHDFKGYSLEKFKNYLDKYKHRYNNERIKLNLGGMSHVQYRLSHS